MGIVRLRNVTTGEIKDVESQSDEYAELINEVYDHDGSARPKWENTSEAHVRRMDSGDVQEEDLGYKFKPVPGSQVDVSEIGPELHPERALTEAEVEAGIESYEDKMGAIGLLEREQNLGVHKDVEPLGRVEPGKRVEEGVKAAGSSRRKSSKKSSSSSGSGSGSGSSSGSGSGSGSSSSGSSSSGSSSSGGSGS